MKDALSTKTKQFEDVLKDLMKTMAGSVQAISALKVASVDKVVFESNKLLYQILKAPYNHYSPVLEHDEIERIRLEKFDYSDDVQGYEPFQLKPSSRVRFNMASGLWTAEDGSTTTMPFGVHQIYEEIVAPVVQNLMAEGDERAAKIYRTIGTCFGYAIAHYADFYEIKNLLILGRVSSGKGGEVIIEEAKKVLAAEFPALAEKIKPASPAVVAVIGAGDINGLLQYL